MLQVACVGFRCPSWITLIFISAGWTVGICSCTGSAVSPTSRPQDVAFSLERPFWPSNEAALFESALVWSRFARGAVTDLAVSQSQERLLVATQPESEIPGSDPRIAVSVWNGKGKPLWKAPLAMGTKGVALHSNGDQVVVANYNDEAIAFQKAGRKQWEVLSSCRPTLLETLGLLLCYHDDDAEPFLAFEAFDLKTGRKSQSYPIQRDILALKVSADQKFVALGMSGGVVELLSVPGFQKVAQWKADGEVTDLAVSNQGRVGVLISQKQVAVFDLNQSAPAEIQLPLRFNQIGMPPQGDHLALYGNTTLGSRVALFEEENRTWKRTQVFKSDRPSEYHSVLQVFADHWVVGIEELEGEKRLLRLVSGNWSGEKVFEIPVVPKLEGALLSQRAYSGNLRDLYLATDDGWVSRYSFAKERNRAASSQAKNRPGL